METAQDQIIEQATRRDQNYVMGSCKPLSSIFSGADLMIFVGNTMPEVFEFNMGDKFLELTCCIGKQAHYIMNRRDAWVRFHMIGVCESGNKGMITGKCKYNHFSIKSSVDELSVEIKLYFDFELFDMYGFLGVSKEENELISKTFHQLIKEHREAEAFRTGKK